MFKSRKNHKFARLTPIILTPIIQLVVMSCLILVSSVNGQSRNWFEIVKVIEPGTTTRVDIERLFPGITEDKVVRFDSVESITYFRPLNGTLHVSYSTGSCVAKDSLALGKGVVYSFSFWPEKPLKIKRLDLDLKGFEVSREDDTANWIYSNTQNGRMYTVFDNKKLSGLSVGLSKEKEKSLACSGKNNLRPSIQ